MEESTRFGDISALEGRRLVEGVHKVMIASTVSPERYKRLNGCIYRDSLYYEVISQSGTSSFSQLADAIKHYNSI